MRRRKPSENKLGSILIRRGWNVRAAGPPKEAYRRSWDFYRAGNSLVALNPKAEAVMRDFERCWRDSDWPPAWSRGELA
jgi:hypothetical protein